MKTAFLFPGQGAQTPGMGADLYDYHTIYTETFNLCEQGAELNLKEACFEGRRLDEGEVCQPAIFAHTLSLLRAVQSEGVDADICAGLSLGEYAALCAAGIFGVAQCAALVRQRGRIMDEAFPPGAGGMLSVIGFTAEQAEEAIADFPSASVANHLSGLQTVVAGRMPDLIALKEKFGQAGARMATLLPVRSPSHSPLLEAASQSFLSLLRREDIGVFQKTVYSNALGAPYPGNADIGGLLSRQMRSRVRWHDCTEHMIGSGARRFVEIGPGSVLSKMLGRRVDKGTETVSVRDRATLEKFLDSVR
jgi:(acyl-carrier-protein) S-malonyltransferase